MSQNRDKNKVIWLSPGDPNQRTGGYLYNHRVVAGLRASGSQVTVVAVPGTWPEPMTSERRAIEASLATLAPGVAVVADGFLWPGLADAGRALAARNPVIVLVHALLCRETGLSEEAAKHLDRVEAASYPYAKRLVATSRMSQREVSERAPGRAIDVVVPGTDPAPTARGEDGHTVLTVGTLIRRKGHDLLIEALARLDVPWRLHCAGAARDLDWAQSLKDRVARNGLADRVSFLGDLDGGALDAAFDRADLLAQPAHYESFGMAVAEGVARGLPVLTGPAGVVDHLPAGSVRVVQGGIDGWTEALRCWLTDPVERRSQGERARACAVPTWDDAVFGWRQILEEVS